MKGVHLLRKFDLNPNGFDWFVGDIHGSVTKLKAALDEREFDYDVDRLFAVGDLIDRGPENREALDLLATDWFFSVLGNHEEFLLRAGQGSDDLWRMNGGEWAFNEFGHPEEDLYNYGEWLKQHCPLAIEVATPYGRIGVIHSDPPDDWEQLSLGDAPSYLWGRRRMNRKQRHHVRGVDWVVYGHTPQRAPVTLGNTTNIDTGACFGAGHFTLLREDEVIDMEKAA